jgi:hypothetical protein
MGNSNSNLFAVEENITTNRAIAIWLTPEPELQNIISQFSVRISDDEDELIFESPLIEFFHLKMFIEALEDEHLLTLGVHNVVLSSTREPYKTWNYPIDKYISPWETSN